MSRKASIPVQAGDRAYDFTPEQKQSKLKAEAKKLRLHRKFARQKNKSSNRRKKTKHRIAKVSEKVANIRNDFCHKTSRSIVNDKKAKVIILEDLGTKRMTTRAKVKRCPSSGKWLKNGSKAKSGLNKSILDKGWHRIEAYLKYKSARAGKAVFKVSAYQTSQECADCGHTHPDNRKSQSLFSCGYCGNQGNADQNAASVIKKRAINLILHSGTELSKKGVLLLDRGRGAMRKTRGEKSIRAVGCETSKKKRRAIAIAAA